MALTLTTQRQIAQNVTQMSTILEFGDVIKIHHEKCIEISTNMPNIGFEIPDLAFEISEFLT